jgi:RNA ligase (TIGR02306 family)
MTSRRKDMELTRKLATIRKVDRVSPIEGANNIELAHVGGWKCVVKKGEFKEGDLCVYFEIDSFLPEDPRFEFLRKSCFKEVNGERGFRIRTIKLRGQISQGLALPLSDFPEIKDHKEGDDITEILRVKKYEPPIPVALAGDIYGVFPTHLVPKTDQERAENLVSEILDKKHLEFEVTRKMDGTSCTIYKYNGHFGVCSRNYELKNSDTKKPVYWIVAERYRLSDLLPEGFAIQGEVVGRGIQGNSEGLNDIDLYVFDVYDIKENRYLAPEERYKFVKDISAKHVPIIYESFVLSLYLNLGADIISELRKVANCKTLCGKIGEGVVFKSSTRDRFSFKVINPEYLLREE